MRKLQTNDVFEFCRVIKRIGLKEEIRDICLRYDSLEEMQTAEAGFDIIFSLFDKATEENSEDELYKFIARIFETDVDSVSKMDPIDLINSLLEVADKEKWKSFFKFVASSMKKSK